MSEWQMKAQAPFIPPSLPQVGRAPNVRITPRQRPRTDTTLPGSLVTPKSDNVHPQTMPARVASTNAAIAAIQSVRPFPIAPVPKYNPKMATASLPQLPGADIKDEIKFDAKLHTVVVDEVTAQKSTAEYSKFLNTKRRTRRLMWNQLWGRRLDLNDQILEIQKQCLDKALETVDEFEYEDDRKPRPLHLPLIYANKGAFDVPKPASVIIPDPEIVVKEFNQMRSQRPSDTKNSMNRRKQPNSRVGK